MKPKCLLAGLNFRSKLDFFMNFFILEATGLLWALSKLQAIFLTLFFQSFFQDLDSVLHDPKYTENAIKYGSVLNDQITRPLDRAIWWIEHIMRHPFMYQGKSPVHKLYWFQYFLLDVIAFYLFIIYVVFKIIKFIVCKLCCSSSQKAKNDWDNFPNWKVEWLCESCSAILRE